MATTVSPVTENVLRRVEETSEEDLENRLQMSATAFQNWRGTTCAQRGEKLRRVSELLRERKADYGRLITEEMGKPVTQAIKEVSKCSLACDYYAEHAEEFLAPRVERQDGPRSYVRYDPLGPILAVMPWNFPFWQVFRHAAPAVMAGNTVVLKHASNVPGVAKAIEDLFVEADFPTGVLVSLELTNERTEPLAGHPEIRAVTLTGSDRAGRAVAAVAGQHLKKCVLELGGSDPFLVLADANVPEVAATAARARCQNSGQSCIAAKRFIVEEPVLESFTDAFVSEMQRLSVGDPMDESTDVGPLARKDLLENLHRQVEESVQAGARLRTGGRPLETTGFFYPPTVLDQVRPGMPVFDEETFGPVAAVVAARDEDHAVELANHTSYGLGASIWTDNAGHGETLVPRIDAGAVFVNSMVASDPRLPFGGVKQSGYGRELAAEGIREFVNVKTVRIG